MVAGKWWDATTKKVNDGGLGTREEREAFGFLTRAVQANPYLTGADGL